MLRGDEQFAGESGFTGAAAKSFFGRKKCEIGIVVFLRHVREDEIAGAGVETIRVGKIFADSVIGKVSGAREHALLNDPGVGANLEHVEVVVGFENETIGFAEVNFDKFGHVAEICADGDLSAVGTESESDRVGGIVRNGEGVDIDITDAEALAGLNGFDATEALAKSLGENALERSHGGFSDVERSFPEAEDLRKTIAVISVLVSDQYSIEMIEVTLDGSEASESFAFAKASVNKDAGAFGFEQSKIARAAGRQDGDA